MPVNFDKKQREYTRKAADLAGWLCLTKKKVIIKYDFYLLKQKGLKVLALADEPTLAAMAYGLHEQSYEKKNKLKLN